MYIAQLLRTSVAFAKDLNSVAESSHAAHHDL